MSDFVRTLNLVKARRSISWLTPSQHRSLTTLRDMLRVPGSINLFGRVGVGKTFVAWTLADDLGFTYFPHISCLSEEGLNTTLAIIDNCRPDRQSHRIILKTLHFHNVKSAVIITRQRVMDSSRWVEVKLTEADLLKGQENLASIGLFPAIDRECNLWNLVNPLL